MITLVWYGERKTPYELGENNVHIALVMPPAYIGIIPYLGEQRAHRARDGRF